MNNRDLSQKVRTVVMLISVVIMLAACRVEEPPPEMVHVTAVSAGGTEKLLLSVCDPESLEPLDEEPAQMNYEAESGSYSCFIEQPLEESYVLHVVSEDKTRFGAAESMEAEDGEFLITLRRSYSIGDRGPADGLICLEYRLGEYLDRGVRYLEAAPEELIENDLKHDEGVAYCDELDYSGEDVWFLPTVNELNAVSDVLSGTGTEALVCWSSERVDDYSYLAYTLEDGETSAHTGVTRHSIWPVRSF